MKASLSHSGNQMRKGQGRRPVVAISIEPETEEERAILRMAYSGRRRLYVYESGAAALYITMPRGSNED